MTRVVNVVRGEKKLKRQSAGYTTRRMEKEWHRRECKRVMGKSQGECVDEIRKLCGRD